MALRIVRLSNGDFISGVVLVEIPEGLATGGEIEEVAIIHFAAVAATEHFAPLVERNEVPGFEPTGCDYSTVAEMLKKQMVVDEVNQDVEGPVYPMGFVNMAVTDPPGHNGRLLLV